MIYEQYENGDYPLFENESKNGILEGGTLSFALSCHLHVRFTTYRGPLRISQIFQCPCDNDIEIILKSINWWRQLHGRNPLQAPSKTQDVHDVLVLKQVLLQLHPAKGTLRIVLAELVDVAAIWAGRHKAKALLNKRSPLKAER